MAGKADKHEDEPVEVWTRLRDKERTVSCEVGSALHEYLESHGHSFHSSAKAAEDADKRDEAKAVEAQKILAAQPSDSAVSEAVGA